MMKFKKNKAYILTISFLITSFLFFVAGNLIFVQQPTSTFTTLDSIKFSKISNNKPQIDNNNSTSRATNSEKPEDNKKFNAPINSQKDVPSKLNYSSNKKDTKRESILTLEGDYFALFKLKPDYPPHALKKELEGVCLVSYTIETNGTVKDVSAVESECDDWFRKASIEAAKSFVYKPRVKNGVSVEVENIRNKFVFKILEK